LLAGGSSSPLVASAGTVLNLIDGKLSNVVLGSFQDGDVGQPPSADTVSIDWGDGTGLDTATGAVVGAGGQHTVVGSHLYAQYGTYNINITVVGSSAGVQSLTATANVADLEAKALTVQETEGTAVNAPLATFVDVDNPAGHNHTAAVDWGDGTAVDTGVTITGANGLYTVAGVHTYARAGNFAINVTVFDTQDGTSATATGSAQVSYALPDVQGQALSATEGASLNTVTVATLTGGNASELLTDYHATINWGDDSGPTDGQVQNENGTYTIRASHTYVAPQSFPIQVTLTSNAGDTAVGVGSCVVAPATLSATGTAISSVEGTGATGIEVARFTTSDLLATPDRFDVRIDWGDGSPVDTTSGALVPVTAGAYSVRGTHTYDNAGTYAVTATVEDTAGVPERADGSSGPGNLVTTTATATVAEAALAIQGAGQLTVHASNTGTVTLATFTDASSFGTASDYHAQINWGDGQSSAGTVGWVDGTTWAVTGSHVYAYTGPAPHPLQVSIQDAGGSTATAATSVAINLAQLGGQDAITGAPSARGASGQLTVLVGNGGPGPEAQVRVLATGQPGCVRTLTWDPSKITLFDGQAPLNGGWVTLNESAGDKVYTAVATTALGPTDSTGASLQVFTASGAQAGNDAILLSRLPTGVPVSVVEGPPTGPVTVAAFSGSNGPASAYNAVIDWGDGSATSSGTVSGTNGEFTVTGGHVYQGPGNFSITVTVQGPAGAIGSARSQAQVADAALSASGMAFTAMQGVAAQGVVATWADLGGLDGTGMSSDLVANYLALIDWGDGTPTDTGTLTQQPDGTLSVSGGHTYEQSGSFPIAVTILSLAGSTVTAQSTVTVTAATLSATGTSATAVEGAESLLTLATVTSSDPNVSADADLASIDWGDGSPLDTGLLTTANGATRFQGDHLYAAAGTYTVTATVGVGASTVTVSTTVTVADAPLTAQAAPVITMDGTATGRVLLATFTDADPQGQTANYTATIDWGDGQQSAGVIEPNVEDDTTLEVWGEHTYASTSGSPWTVQVTIQDAGGSTASATTAVRLRAFTLDGRDAGVGTDWASPALAEQGILLGDGTTSHEAALSSRAVGVSGDVRNIIWDPTRVVVFDGTTALTSGGLTLDESAGDKVLTVVALPDFAAGDAVAFTEQVWDANGLLQAAVPAAPAAAAPPEAQAMVGGARVRVRLSAVSFSGDGMLPLERDVDPAASGPFPTGPDIYISRNQTFAGSLALTRDIDYSKPAWQRGPTGGPNDFIRYEPLAYVQQTAPVVTPVIDVVTAAKLAAPASFSVTASLRTDPGAPIRTEAGTFSTDASVSKQLPFTFGRLLNQVGRFFLTFDWTVKIDGGRAIAIDSSRNLLFVTFAKPAGLRFPLNAKQLEKAVSDAQGKSDIDSIVNMIGRGSVDMRYFNPNYARLRGVKYPFFAALDIDPRTKQYRGADCISLARLMASQLRAVGIPTTSWQVMFVYARTYSWNGISSNRNGMQEGRVGDLNARLFFWSAGPNAFEGCVRYVDSAGKEEWWMGGTHFAQMSRNDPTFPGYLPSAFGVLRHWVRTNENDPTEPENDWTPHQYWSKFGIRPDGIAIPYVRLPDVVSLGRDQARLKQAIADRGFVAGRSVLVPPGLILGGQRILPGQVLALSPTVREDPLPPGTVIDLWVAGGPRF
jgi:hypothetical protein